MVLPSPSPLDSCESRNHPGLAKATKEDENGTAPGGATRANYRRALGGGQAPALRSPLPTPLDSGPRIGVRGMLLIAGMTSRGAGMTNERLLERSIPDRSPGHAFIAIAHAGWRRHTKV